MTDPYRTPAPVEPTEPDAVTPAVRPSFRDLLQTNARRLLDVRLRFLEAVLEVAHMRGVTGTVIHHIDPLAEMWFVIVLDPHPRAHEIATWVDSILTQSLSRAIRVELLEGPSPL